MTTLSGSSAVESTAIPTITNTAYGKTKPKEGVEIEEYEMVDKPPETISPPAAQPETTVGTEDDDVYEDIPVLAEQ